MQELLRLPRVERVNFDMCMMGLLSRDSVGEAAARKRLSIVTNSEAIAALLSASQCDRQHRHATLLAGQAKGCEAYTLEFCRTLCEGYSRHVALDTAREDCSHLGGVFCGEMVDATAALAPLVAHELS